METTDDSTARFSPRFLTIPEAAERLRISRNSAYAAAKIYRHSRGREGLPNFALGRTYRVPAWALDRLGLHDGDDDPPIAA